MIFTKEVCQLLIEKGLTAEDIQLIEPCFVAGNYEFIKAVAGGKRVVFEDTVEGVYFDSNPSCYKIIEPKKPVDLSVLIKSGIDCEFSDGTSFKANAIEALHSISQGYFEPSCGTSFEFCRPRMNHWHSWQGGECPLPDGVRVDIKVRDGLPLDKFEVSQLHWLHGRHSKDRDIIAFRVIGLAEGYCWPWECDNE